MIPLRPLHYGIIKPNEGENHGQREPATRYNAYAIHHSRGSEFDNEPNGNKIDQAEEVNERSLVRIEDLSRSTEYFEDQAEEDNERFPVRMDDDRLVKVNNDGMILFHKALGKIAVLMRANLQPQNAKLIQDTNKLLSDMIPVAQRYGECFNNPIKVINEAFDIFVYNLSNLEKGAGTKHVVLSRSFMLANQAIATLSSFICRNAEYGDAIRIECALFEMAFSVRHSVPNPLNRIIILPVFQEQDKFITGDNDFYTLKSSTGSGKTRCAPFFFAIRSILEGMKQPFLIMTQKGKAIISSKIEDLRKYFRNNAIVTDKVDEMIHFYSDTQTKPIIGILSSYNALNLLSHVNRNDLFSQTRFCLDEAHERSVDFDVLIAILTNMLAINRGFRFKMLMMTATPDKNVIKCYKNMQSIELNDSRLFEVIENNKFAKNLNDVPEKMATEINRIIGEMAEKRREIGHIMCFLSGISACYALISSITNPENNKQIPNVHFVETYLKKRDVKAVKFYSHLQKEINKLDENVLIILPIFLTGSVDQIQKRIAEFPLRPPFEGRVFKLIAATNLVESSITIDGLAAVIDSCLYKKPDYDFNRGITTLNETMITKSMQIQRKGRVGRTQKGEYVSIMVEGQHLADSLVPSILTEDLSNPILSLRNIGIKFENISNLPDQPDRSTVIKSLSELKSMNALIETGEITEFGEKLCEFHEFSPFLSAAIVSFKELLDGSAISSVFATLIIHILISNERLITNPMSEALINNFCKESDIITLLRVMIIILEKNDGENFKEKCGKCGINQKMMQEINGSIQSIIYNAGNQIADPISELKKFMEGRNLMKDIDYIIYLIGKNKPEWENVRLCDFDCIMNITSDKIQYRFKAPSELAYQNGQSLITVRERPGCKCLSSPRHCFIFYIEKNNETQENFGFLIHRRWDYDFEEAAITISYENLNCDSFFEALLLSYLSESEGLFHKMPKSNSDKGIYTEKLLYITQSDNNALISFCPASTCAENKLNESVSKMKKLIPFVPRSILIHNEDPRCALEIQSVMPEKFDSFVHFYGDKNLRPLHAYNLSPNALDFALNCIDSLSSSKMDLRFAVTGDSFIIQKDAKKKEGFMNIRVNMSDDSIFIATKEPHLVLLSESPINTLRELKWISNSACATYNGDSNIGQSGLHIQRDVISTSQSDNFYVFKKKNSMFKIGRGKITDEQIRGELNVRKNGVGKNSSHEINSSISSILDAFSKKYCDGNAITEEIPLECLGTNISVISDQDEVIFSIEKIKQMVSSTIKIECNRIRAIGNDAFGVIYNSASSVTGINMAKTVVSMLRSSGSFYEYVDTIPVSTVQILYKKQSPQPFNKYNEALKTAMNKFGFATITVNDNVDFVKYQNDELYEGYFSIRTLNNKFAQCLDGEIRNAISEINRVDFHFPSRIASRVLLSDKLVRREIMEWSKDNNLSIHDISQDRFSIPYDKFDKANDLLKDERTTFKPSFCAIQIPSSAKLGDIKNAIKKEHHKGPPEMIWRLDNSERFIIAKNELENEVRELLAPFKNVKNTDVLGCYQNCDNPKKFHRPITLFNKDSTTIMRSLCKDCTLETMRYVTSRYVNNGSLDLEKLFQVGRNPSMISFIESQQDYCTQSYWPQIPIGQLIWIIAEENDDFCLMARTWITAILQGCLHCRLQDFTFCPDHPHQIFKRPIEGLRLNCSISGCRMFYCPQCFSWHLPGECKDRNWWNGMSCPCCNVPTEKNGGCNHISCACGCHWCYNCREGFKTKEECYSHMNEKHGAYWDPGTMPD